MREDIARAYCEIEQARLLTFRAADKMDREGNKAARDLIAAAKVVVPAMAARGRLDALVNNAVLSPLRSIADTDLGLFTKTVEVDLRGYWYLSAEAAKLMQGRGGSIVNMASVAALHPDQGLALYSTLKTALIGMSRSFALEYGPHGVRVNTLLPG